MITIIVNRVEEHSQLPYLQKLANAFEVFENFRGKLSPRVSKDEHFLNETVSQNFFAPIHFPQNTTGCLKKTEFCLLKHLQILLMIEEKYL